ncbi:MAG: MerR family transcriptional regulator [Anaerolineae bacterium]|nr:MerR family transcriptional regulator [Anaerolineae bacterium]
MARRTMTAKEATALLGINTATLYSYVSRGLIRSEPADDGKRARRYVAEDVQRLAERKAQRRNPANAAKTALDWGVPVLESALTLITERTVYYRGQDAARLAHSHTFEQVAALLWTDSVDETAALFAQPPVTLPDAAWREAPEDALLPSLHVALAHGAAADLQAYDLSPEGAARTGARLVRLLARAIVRTPVEGRIADALAGAWHCAHPDLLNAALILCADHELNASAFAARIVASTGATPYAVVQGGLAALSGFRHGGMTLRVAALMREVDGVDSVEAALRARMQRGEGLPGFGHRLYPEDDPRAAALLTMLREAIPDASALATADRLAGVVRALTGHAPNIDFALATLAHTLKLPGDAPLALFALGRSAGWIAHAIEQYSLQKLIRPRARYVGRAAESTL